MRALTGKTRYRTSFRRKLILQVQYKYRHYESMGGAISGNDRYAWRDALVEDFPELGSAAGVHTEVGSGD